MEIKAKALNELKAMPKNVFQRSNDELKKCCKKSNLPEDMTSKKK